MEFAFVHLPKAAGTALVNQLDARFPGRLIHDYDHDPIAGHDVRYTAEQPPLSIVGACGHFHASRYARWSKLLITMLREPVENIISVYYFWSSYSVGRNTWHSRFLSEKPDIFQFAEQYPFRNLMSDMFFGGFDMSRLDFTGFHDRRESDFMLLSSLLGVDLDFSYIANKSTELYDTERNHILADTASLDRLRSILNADVRFYEDIRAKLD